METLGIIGVGHLASYFVAGLRNAGDKRRILLSPRNAEIAADLAHRYQCEVLCDNQSVADQADILLLATRPAHSLLALQALTLRPSLLVLSVVAGVSIDDLRDFAAPADIARCLPLAPVEVGAGATPLLPNNPRARQLLEAIATVVTVEDEKAFELAAVASCTSGWVFQIIAELQSWLEKAGMNQQQARTIAIETFHGAAHLAKMQPELNLQQQADKIGTEGTYTKFFIDQFREAQGFQALHTSGDNLLKSLLKTSDDE
ncbi:MAG: NAD(P)-binding domain-containing protein [Oceanospirillaceae bacterium]